LVLRPFLGSFRLLDDRKWCHNIKRPGPPIDTLQATIGVYYLSGLGTKAQRHHFGWALEDRGSTIRWIMAV
jgi:hypothetical protein